jgi:TPR repeat protein
MLRDHAQMFNTMKDFYFEYAQSLWERSSLSSEPAASDSGLTKLIKQASTIKTQMLNERSKVPKQDIGPVEKPFVEAFFYLYTAANLGHARARSQVAVIYFQNGLVPSKSIIKRAIFGIDGIKGRFSFLQYISPDILHLLKDEKMTEVEFMKHFVQSESMVLLYLGS